MAPIVETLRRSLPTCFSFFHSACCEVTPATVRARFEALVLALSDSASIIDVSGNCVAAAGSRSILRLQHSTRDGRVRTFMHIEAVPTERSVYYLVYSTCR